MSFRRLLKDSATGLYYDGKGGWVSNHADAHSYHDTETAVLAAHRLDRKTLHLILKFPDERMDISHPLAEVRPPGSMGGTATILAVNFVPAAGILAGLCK